MIIISNETDLFGTNNNLFSHVFTFSNPDYDITSKEYKSQVRNSSNDLIAEFQITKNTESRSIMFLIPESVMKTIKTGSYFWDLKENGITKVKGKFNVVKGVTQ